MVLLLMFITVNATMPTERQLDKTLIKKINRLRYSNSTNDVANLKELSKLKESNLGKGYDTGMFKDIFLSYPNELLLNYIILTDDKKINPLYLHLAIIDEKRFYDIVPYLIVYLEENLKGVNITDDLHKNGYEDFIVHSDILANNQIKVNQLSVSIPKLFNILGNSERKDAIPFLRKNLQIIDNFGDNTKASIIINLGKLGDNESIEKIFEFCKMDLLSKNLTPYQSHFQDCLKTFQYYQNPKFIGFVIEGYLDTKNFDKLDYYLTKEVFPSFALDSSIYGRYSTDSSYHSVDNEVLTKKWKEWYKQNKHNVIWSKKVSKFIEEGTEDKIEEYLKIITIKQTQDISNAMQKEEHVKVDFLQRIVNWLKNIFT